MAGHSQEQGSRRKGEGISCSLTEYRRQLQEGLCSGGGAGCMGKFESGIRCYVRRLFVRSEVGAGCKLVIEKVRKSGVVRGVRVGDSGAYVRSSALPLLGRQKSVLPARGCFADPVAQHMLETRCPSTGPPLPAAIKNVRASAKMHCVATVQANPSSHRSTGGGPLCAWSPLSPTSPRLGSSIHSNETSTPRGGLMERVRECIRYASSHPTKSVCVTRLNCPISDVKLLGSLRFQG